MLKIAFRYLLYRLFGPHRKGFGVHSPFVYRLVTKVLKREDDEVLREIYDWRKRLSNDRSIINTSDTGAGSKVHVKKGRRVKQIVRRSSTRHKYGRVLYWLVKEFQPACIIELGTGIGISTAYLVKACSHGDVISIEGDEAKMTLAARNLEQIGLQNVMLKNGSFRDILPDILKNAGQPLLVFIDGDHSYEATMVYFAEILQYSNTETIIVFDDIRWSLCMEKAWNTIKNDPSVAVSIDLFFMGMIFFRGGIPKQDFVINF